ncbi:DUF4260 domain-containing protein [Marinicauda salina]|uniref:DUF4260 domain-containing protein n=2 Tax=Marinicauda salina TaxID=2135793 RepID=A0A2U2BS96_9PROT|nr:DUF4260 domain-containing protein [Marinicauda salina]
METGCAAGWPGALLRTEGAAMLVLSGLLYAAAGAPWWLAGVLFLAPDLSMAAYLAGPRVGAAVYNAAHSYAGPVALGAAGLVVEPALIPFALIWAGHVGFDRFLGYGLKYAAGFKSTHLGRIGRVSPIPKPSRSP